MAYRVLVTGSRDWTDKTVVWHALQDVYGVIDASFLLIVGDCPSGADLIATQLAIAIMDMPVEIHKADWDTHGKKAGPLRNQAMVDSGADICLAFLKDDSRGTWDCIRRTRAAGIPTYVWTLTSPAPFEIGETDA